MRLRALNIFVGDCLVGKLFQYGEMTRFQVEDSYADDFGAPVLSLSFVSSNFEQRRSLLRDVLNPKFNGKEDRLPTFFQNLLPEGLLRQHLAKLRGCDPSDHFELLAACGGDLPGNVYALPVDLNRDEVASLVTQSQDSLEMSVMASAMAEGFSLSGMQPKLSLCEDGGRYTFRGRLGSHSIIGKLPTVDYPLLPELEMLSMRLARLAGVNACDCDLVQMGSLDMGDFFPVAAGGHFLAVKRFDRGPGVRYQVEDFAQVFSVDPSDKYKQYSYLDMMRLMMGIPSLGLAAVEELLRRLLVNELLGNYDAHLKNLGLIYLDGKRPTLSPAYDIVAYSSYISGRGHALSITGSGDKHERLSPSVLRTICNELGVSEAPLRGVVRESVLMALSKWETEIVSSPLLEKQKENLLAHFRSHPLVKRFN